MCALFDKVLQKVSKVGAQRFLSAPHLVAFPLWGLHHDLASMLSFAELASEPGKGLLVSSHVDSQRGEVGELGGKTHSVAIHEHGVASLIRNLVNLESTSALHGSLKLGDEVLAKTHWPARTHLTDSFDVLVNEAINLGDGTSNLDVLAREDQRDRGGAEALTGGSLGLDVGEGSSSLQQVSDGHEVAALALGEVVGDLVRSSGSIGLEGQVVVGDLLAVALDQPEHVVGHVLDLDSDLGGETLLHDSDVLVGTLLNSLGASLTELDSTGESLVKVVLHGRALDTDELAVGSIGVLPVASNLGQVTDTTLGTGGVGSDSVDQSVHTGLEHGLGGTELTSGGSLGVRELLLHTGKDLLLVGGGLVEGDVKLLGRLGEVLGEGAHVTGLAVTSLGESGVRVLRESGDLLLGGGLVLVHELAEHATGTDVGGVASVGDPH